MLTAGMDVQAFQQQFSRLAQTQGFHEISLLETAAGPIRVWEKDGEGPRVYLSAGMHGDEPAGPLAMLALLERGIFTAGIRWQLCPVINPVGLAAGTRTNAAGIDMNRDYLLRRSAEVSAHAAWLESLPVPDLFLSLHEDCDADGFYLYEINLGADRPDRAAAVLEAVQAHVPLERAGVIDGHDPRGHGWIFHVPEADEPDGWPEAIFLAKRGCPLSFTFETPSALPLGQRVAAHVAAVESAVRVVCC